MGKGTQCGWELEGGGGRGAAQQSLIRGDSAPSSNPLPFPVPLFTEKVSFFVHLLLTNGTPFAYRVKNATFPLTVVNGMSNR